MSVKSRRSRVKITRKFILMMTARNFVLKVKMILRINILISSGFNFSVHFTTKVALEKSTRLILKCTVTSSIKTHLVSCLYNRTEFPRTRYMSSDWRSSL